jgi:hypothetical protein
MTWGNTGVAHWAGNSTVPANAPGLGQPQNSAALFMIDSALVHPSSAVGGPRLDAIMIVESVVPMLGSERGPLYHLLHLYWF